jgi:DNA-binding response OmpR family regulator
LAITLLAVDDSVTMRKVLEITFAGENYKTLVASNGQEAMNLLKSEKPAIALIDHTLPDGSGYDLAHQIKQRMPNVAVLVLSSKQNPYDKARGQASGVDDFMDKPFDTQKFIDKVTQVLSQPRAAAAPAAAAHAAPPAPAAPAPAPAARAPAAVAASRHARTQTLSYGTPAPPGVASAPTVGAAPRTQTTPGTPKPATAAPAPAPAARPAAPAPIAAPAPRPMEAAAAAATAAISAGNGQLTGKLEGLGLTPAQVDGVLSLSREVVERVVWEVVPVLAEALIKEEIRRLTSG